jgi:hypothetical protein
MGQYYDRERVHSMLQAQLESRSRFGEAANHRQPVFKHLLEAYSWPGEEHGQRHAGGSNHQKSGTRNGCLILLEITLLFAKARASLYLLQQLRRARHASQNCRNPGCRARFHLALLASYLLVLDCMLLFRSIFSILKTKKERHELTTHHCNSEEVLHCPQILHSLLAVLQPMLYYSKDSR